MFQDSLQSKNAACQSFVSQLNESLAVWGVRLPVDARYMLSYTRPGKIVFSNCLTCILAATLNHASCPISSAPVSFDMWAIHWLVLCLDSVLIAIFMFTTYCRVVYSKMGGEICDFLLSTLGEGANRDEQFNCFDTAFSAPIPEDLRSGHLQDAVCLYTSYLSEIALRNSTICHL